MKKYMMQLQIYLDLLTASPFHVVDIDLFHTKYAILTESDQNTIQYFRNQMQKQIDVLKGLVNKAAPILSEIIQKVN